MTRLLLILALALPLHAGRYVTDRTDAPVRWVEWGPAALERAVKEKRPIFLSTGLVADNAVERMHREAFINGENAEALNAYFVPVLLDAVTHPEVARAAEMIAEAMGAGGTPTHLILTPKLEPFAAAGFLSTAELGRLLVINANRWVSEREAVAAEGRANLTKAQALAGSVWDDADVRTLPAEELRALAASRLRDVLGGGFHPCEGCFEKMLDDQARYALAYLQAWRVTKDPADARVVRTTLDYALRDLRLPGTWAFEASQDAHSFVPAQGPELMNGAFYGWRREEVERLLGAEGAAKVWPALEDPRLMHESHDELAPLLSRLLEVRQKRPAPFREPAAVAGWNGLMLSALSRTATAMNVPEYLDAATRAAADVAARLWKKNVLLHAEGGAEADAEDYALLAAGLLDLYEAGGDIRWLELAMALQARLDTLFDPRTARYAAGRSLPEAWRGLVTANDAGIVAASNLIRLAGLTGDAALRARGQMLFEAAGLPVPDAPRITVVTGDPRRLETHELLRAWRERLDPMRAVVFVPNKGTARDKVTKVLPFTRALAPDEKLPVAYECAGGECVRSSSGSSAPRSSSE